LTQPVHLPQMSQEWVFRAMDFWAAIHPYLTQAGYFALVQCLAALFLPWMCLAVFEFRNRRAREKAKAILS
jgi:hypothetical protein